MNRLDVCPPGEMLPLGLEMEEVAASSKTGTPGTDRSCCDRSPLGAGAPGQWESGRCLPHHLGPQDQKAADSLDRAQGSHSDQSVPTGRA